MISSTYQYLLSLATGKEVEDVAVKRENLANRVSAYTSQFDFSLNKQWDEQKDQQKVQQRKANAQEMTNAYYDIATDFYEYGWGQSFHFATRYNGESFEASLARHEHFLALKLQLKKGEKALDLGCGVGGPLRSISRFSSATVVGLNNNEYQVKRALKLNKQAGLAQQTDVVKGDFMALPFPAASFDKAYAIEATCHAPDRTKCFQQVNKALKKDGLFAVYEWTMTDKFDAQNAEHCRVKHGIETGNSLPTLVHYREVLANLEAAGFEILEHYDVAQEESNGQIPWYASLAGSFTLAQFKHTKIGRFCTNLLCEAMERAHFAPKGTTETAKLLSDTGDALAESGRLGIFTPMYFVLCRKREEVPEQKEEEKKEDKKEEEQQ